MTYIGILLAITFLFSVGGLYALCVALSAKDPKSQQSNAAVIFHGQVGHIEDPAASISEQRALQEIVSTEPSSGESPITAEERIALDQSSRAPVRAFLYGGLFWLLVASVAGLTASLKLHMPDWLTSSPELTFGRIRTVHLNAVAYGWASMTAIAVSLWMFPRLLRTPLVGGRYAVAGAVFWHAGMLLGALAIMFGWNGGMEWLEIPKPITPLIEIGGALVGVPLVLTLLNRKVKHLYVSVWYLTAAVLWFPTLYVIANLPAVHFGAQSAIVNWWFGHSVLGYWVTPTAVGTLYYLIPKTLGRPVASYNLSVIGFWALALFYGQAGVHHLVGGPVPTWLMSFGIGASLMMMVPVLAFGGNLWLTMKGNWGALKYSPTLRFAIVGAIGYVGSSCEGSFEALRSVSQVAHFTHFTVAHAHFGLYFFFSFVMFAAVYFALPRIVEREWPYPKLISWHFWLCLIGVTIYIVGLSIGGWLQGELMLDVHHPFIDSVAVTIPYLKARSVGGALMTLGHLVFLFHCAVMLWARQSVRTGAALLQKAAA